MKIWKTIFSRDEAGVIAWYIWLEIPLMGFMG